jgi:chemotaxis protein MotB
MPEEQPIVVIKKKSGHGGHHGGAWKVAYADFVTAMMSLFIVLWLMNSTPKPVQEAIAGYFNDPRGTATKKGSEGKPIPKKTKESKEAQEKKDMANLKQDLTKAIESIAVLNKVKKQIEISVTDEGLRIELVESEKGTFFETGSPRPTPMLADILKVLAEQLKGIPNHISIEGYTDAQPYVDGTTYGNWELSTDRANVTRRVMQSDGLRLDQVSQVRGFADQRLHVPDKPFDAGNRRVSLIVQNLPLDQKDSLKPNPNLKESIAATPPAESNSAAAGQAQASESLLKPAAAVLPSETAKPAAGLLSRARGMFAHK